MAEFAVALFILFFFVLFPFIDLMGFAAGVATQYLITRQAATVASASASYQQALDAMEAETKRLCESGLGRFAHITPRGCYNGNGADLYVVVTDISRRRGYLFGPNYNVPNPIDTKRAFYQYRVVTRFSIAPFLNLSSVPFIGGLPVLGRETVLCMSCDRYIERPEALGRRATSSGRSTNTMGGGNRSAGALSPEMYGGGYRGEGEGGSANPDFDYNNYYNNTRDPWAGGRAESSSSQGGGVM